MEEIKEVITEARSIVAEVVWEEKINLAKDVEKARSWDVVVWREALAKLTARPFNACQDPIGKRR